MAKTNATTGQIPVPVDKVREDLNRIIGFVSEELRKLATGNNGIIDIRNKNFSDAIISLIHADPDAPGNVGKPVLSITATVKGATAKIQKLRENGADPKPLSALEKEIGEFQANLIAKLATDEGVRELVTARLKKPLLEKVSFFSGTKKKPMPLPPQDKQLFLDKVGPGVTIPQWLQEAMLKDGEPRALTEFNNQMALKYFAKEDKGASKKKSDIDWVILDVEKLKDPTQVEQFVKSVNAGIASLPTIYESIHQFQKENGVTINPKHSNQITKHLLSVLPNLDSTYSKEEVGDIANKNIRSFLLIQKSIDQLEQAKGIIVDEEMNKKITNALWDKLAKFPSGYLENYSVTIMQDLVNKLYDQSSFFSKTGLRFTISTADFAPIKEKLEKRYGAAEKAAIIPTTPKEIIQNVLGKLEADKDYKLSTDAKDRIATIVGPILDGFDKKYIAENGSKIARRIVGDIRDNGRDHAALLRMNERLQESYNAYGILRNKNIIPNTRESIVNGTIQLLESKYHLTIKAEAREKITKQLIQATKGLPDVYVGNYGDETVVAFAKQIYDNRSWLPNIIGRLNISAEKLSKITQQVIVEHTKKAATLVLDGIIRQKSTSEGKIVLEGKLTAFLLRNKFDRIEHLNARLGFNVNSPNRVTPTNDSVSKIDMLNPIDIRTIKDEAWLKIRNIDPNTFDVMLGIKVDAQAPLVATTSKRAYSEVVAGTKPVLSKQSSQVSAATTANTRDSVTTAPSTRQSEVSVVANVPLTPPKMLSELNSDVGITQPKPQTVQLTQAQRESALRHGVTQEAMLQHQKSTVSIPPPLPPKPTYAQAAAAKPLPASKAPSPAGIVAQVKAAHAQHQTGGHTTTAQVTSSATKPAKPASHRTRVSGITTQQTQQPVPPSVQHALAAIPGNLRNSWTHQVHTDEHVHHTGGHPPTKNKDHVH